MLTLVTFCSEHVAAIILVCMQAGHNGLHTHAHTHVDPLVFVLCVKQCKA